MTESPILDGISKTEEVTSSQSEDFFSGIGQEDKDTIITSLVDLETNLNAKTDLEPNQIVAIMRAEKYGELMSIPIYAEITELLKELRISRDRLGRGELTTVAAHEAKEKESKKGFFNRIFDRR